SSAWGVRVARLVCVVAHGGGVGAGGRVREARPRVEVVVVGDGERRQERETLVQRRGLSPAVRFLGWRRDMLNVYADLDVVALTSRNEGSPVALIEALAAGRPVGSTAVGGVPEVVINGDTGVTVPVADPRALADAVLTLLADRPLAERLGAAGRRHVYPRYDSSRLVDDVRDLYLRE